MNQLIQALNSLPLFYLFIFGFLVGIAAGFMINRAYRVGIIHVTPGDEEGADTYLFEFNVDPAEIRENRNVQFLISLESKDQQKIQSV